MNSYSTKHGSQYDGFPEKPLQTSTYSQPYFTTNQYNSESVDYQNTEIGNSGGYSGYSSYGNTSNFDGSSQYYHPNDSYNTNQPDLDPPKQVHASGYLVNNNKSSLAIYNPTDGNSSRSHSTFGQFRQYYANRQQNKKSQQDVSQVAPSLFMGKDQSYPNELNALMNPFFCGVCNARLNSIKSANIHYESKAHDKHITAWLKKTYIDKGLSAPEVQRFVTEMSQDAPGEYHCDMCKLELSSAQHALQHFNGKRHRQAVSKVSLLTGIGYFNVEGKWVQTGKLIDKVTGKETSYILVKTPTGFEPVVLQVLSATNAPVAYKKTVQQSDPGEPPAKKPNLEENKCDLEMKKKQEEHYRSMLSDFTTRQQQQEKYSTQPTVPAVKKKPVLPDSTSSSEYQTLLLQSKDSQQSLQSPEEALESLRCKVCNIATTSKDQMLMHLKGARHTKKLKALGECPMVFQGTPATILESLDTNDPLDISMYRTPTGSYYCKMCNAAVQDMARMKRHILSKKHLIAAKSNSTDELPPASDGQ